MMTSPLPSSLSRLSYTGTVSYTHLDVYKRQQVLHNAMGYAAANGFKVCGLDFSPVKGPEGNIEYLMFVQKSDEPGALDDSVAEQVVASSHSTLDR